MHHGILYDIGLAIVAATALAYVARLLRQPLLLAYIGAGLLIGPPGLGLVHSEEAIAELSELGLAFLMFIVGLEIDLKKLVSSGRVGALVGTWQVLACAVLTVGFAMLLDVQKKAATGAKLSGEERFTLQTGAGKISSNNRTDYNLIQGRLRDFAQRSMLLNSAIIWTAALNRGQDEERTTVLGAQLVGNAMTAYVPMWFQYTFRVAAIAQPGQSPRHVLYLEDHIDSAAGMAKGLGNARTPLRGAEVKVPFSIEPASLVEALEKLKGREQAAEAEIAKRTGLTATK